ncbi:MAG: alpha/beta hydrolase [Acidobacteriaceae bacterium]|nr:alpha/beta hydrolase [Acidobacteriaceae bacterium]
MAKEPLILTVPGLWNSGPKHWQSLWERSLLNCRRIEQAEWTAPRCADWIANIDAAVAVAGDIPVFLAAHSAGCIAVAHWAQNGRKAVGGALLVAPADSERKGYPEAAQGFRPINLAKLPFPTIVVASNDDPWLSVERAMYFAESWGSRFVNIGKGGHINADAGFGPWPQGEQLLQELLSNDS